VNIRRIFLGLGVAVVLLSTVFWIDRPRGHVEVRIDRWINASIVILCVRNETDHVVSVRDAFGHTTRGATELIQPTTGVTSSGKPAHQRGIAPKEELQVFLNSLLIHDGVELEIVPWTHQQMLSADTRYKEWPKLLHAWLMRKYRVRPEHRFRLNLPDRSERHEGMVIE
jgi:hypothetical protein